MVVRMLKFRVPKKNVKKMLAFMRRDPRHLLHRSRGLRGAYFLREQGSKNGYAWITVWASNAACRRAVRSPGWQDLLRREKASGFFAGKPDARHYDVLLKP
ncbi:MAG: antibiotic biosynthesis monooxygenase family protein [Candidatus Acidiferrales bacterium]